jgi:hypothetical protein
LAMPLLTEGIEVKGGCYDLDDFCDTRDTLAAGVGDQLHDGRAHPYLARRCNHCAGGRPHSEAKVIVYEENHWSD